MTALAWIVALSLLVLLLVQALPAYGFARLLGRSRPQPAADDGCVPAMVILCLRGDDPFLRDCLRGLLTQDYPDYHVQIVVDQQQDPAWQVAQEMIDELGAEHVTLEPLVERLDTCSLKGSSLVQAVSDLDPRYQVVALLDGDTIPHPTWLRELVAPLADEQIGVASGNRWYMPARATWGALVRYIWNAAGVVQMYWNHFTWGGSVVLRRQIAGHPQLIERWKSAISTDTVILDVVRAAGYRTQFVPSLMMINRESCDLPGFYRWVQRQMVVARLYHRGWLPILLHGIVMTAVPVATIALLVAALAGGHGQATAVIGAAALGYWLGMGWLVVMLERAVRHVTRQRGEATGWVTPHVLIRAFFALPLTQAVYAAALAVACFMRTVSWRGVVYRIEGPQQVRLIQYEPYRAAKATEDPVSSL